MTGGSLYEMIGLSLVMGFSIYLSFPIVLRKQVGTRTTILLVSFAVGILVFLMGDIFSDVASRLYSSGSYIADPIFSLVFAFCVGGFFLLLYLIEGPRSISSRSDHFVPRKVAFIVAVGMGLQNLTEGLVFGSTFVVGLTGLFLVILVGFVLQNFTEGFPIISPFIGRERPKTSYLAGLYFIGGFPTIAGSLVGYFYFDNYINIASGGLAIGAILYVLIPMLRNLFRQSDSNGLNFLVYAGVVLGFIIGFAVNAI